MIKCFLQPSDDTEAPFGQMCMCRWVSCCSAFSLVLWQLLMHLWYLLVITKGSTNVHFCFNFFEIDSKHPKWPGKQNFTLVMAISGWLAGHKANMLLQFLPPVRKQMAGYVIWNKYLWGMSVGNYACRSLELNGVAEREKFVPINDPKADNWFCKLVITLNWFCKSINIV